MTEDRPRWWWCRHCQAVNDGYESSRCWNCETVQRKSKNFPWCEMGKDKCRVCGRSYVTWTLPAGAYLKDEPFALGFCPFHFEHFGNNAYYPPMLPAYMVLEANGYRYDEKKDKLVKVRARKT